MIVRYNASLARRWCLYALPLAMCLLFFFPVPAQAQAILLSSDPANGAIVLSPPSQVRMQFSEDLSPAFSTAAVVNATNHRVDQNDAHVLSDNPQEMDVSLKPFLPSDVYVVVWQTRSADDGDVLRGSFLFKVVAANGTIPSLNGPYPGQNVLAGGNINSGLYTGQMDGPTLFSFIMVTLLDLSTIFWVGAHLWCTFVSQPPEAVSAEQHFFDQRADRRFNCFAIPTLLIALLANLGVLIGQGLLLTGGNFVQVFSLLNKLMSDGHFGIFWTLREIVILLGLTLAIYIFWSRKLPSIIDEIISWINLALGLALLIAMALSGDASATNGMLVYAVLADWLHLLGASLWVGGVIYLAVIYLPVLKGKSPVECTRVLLTILPHFALLAISGMVIVALTGPFDATIHLSTLDQLVTTAYGRALLIKVLCVAALLLTSAIHILFFRPCLNKTFDAYQLAQARAHSEEIEHLEESADVPMESSDAINRQSVGVQFTVPPLGVAPTVSSLEASVAMQITRLVGLLRWEPVLAIAILICTGLMNVFAGTVQPVVVQQNQSQTVQQSPLGKPFNTTVRTTDHQFTIKVTVSPNSFGTNLFTVHVLDSAGKQDTNVSVSLDLTMLDMDMGTEPVSLQPDGKGGFGGEGDLEMNGNWQVSLQIRTSDNKLHEATVKFFTPY